MHLQPDERFLIIVSQKMHLPSSFNPFDLGFSFYVYGTFPLVANKLLSYVTHFSSYNLLTLQGRFLSAFADSITLVFVFLFAKAVGKKEKLSLLFSFFAIFVYAISVLPMQLSHFFTVDMFATTFVFIATYFAFLFSQKKQKFFLILSAIFLGISLACKINVGLVIPLILYFILVGISPKKIVIKKIFPTFLLFFVISFLTLSIADSYMLSKEFLSSLATLYFQYSPLTNYPPAFQWLSKPPVIFSLWNIFCFGLGPIISLLTLGGIIAVIRRKNTSLIPIILWLFLAVGLESLQFAQTMRYFIFFYPFFAIVAAYGYTSLIETKNLFIRLVVVLLLLIWPLTFFSIYLHPNPRITASEWIYQHIPQQDVLLSEYWDDSLPLPIYGLGETYTTLQLPVFSPDTPEKWQTMQAMLSKGDYLILSSPRAWNTIEHLPQKYPRMSVWYKDLFAGKLPYKKVAEFSSYPSLSYLGIPFTVNDTTATEEVFSVFDHPYVAVFKHIR